MPSSPIPTNDAEHAIRMILDPMWDKLSVHEFHDCDDFDAYIHEGHGVNHDEHDILSVWIEGGLAFVSTTLSNGPHLFPLGDPNAIAKIRNKVEELIELGSEHDILPR